MIEKYGMEKVRIAIKDIYMILSYCLEYNGFIPTKEDNNFGPENDMENEIIDIVYDYIDNKAQYFNQNDVGISIKSDAPRDIISIENLWKAVLTHEN